MKNAEYDEVMKVTCPVCEKNIVTVDMNSDDIVNEPCKHLIFWWSGFLADTCFLRKTLKKTEKDKLEILAINDEWEQIEKNQDCTIQRYSTNVMAHGGCQENADYFVFEKCSKNKQNKQNSKTKRSNVMSQILVKSIRGAVISACIENGITSPKEVRKIMGQAQKSVGNMSVAGIQAAITKGQNIYVIEKVCTTSS
jgi:hypothetical protein